MRKKEKEREASEREKKTSPASFMDR